MNALLFERPVWFATGPLMFEEEAQDREEFIYHRPVLVREAIELLAPRPGALVLDADFELLGVDSIVDADEFGAVELVAVLDGVDEGFMDGHMNGEEIVLGEAAVAAFGEQLVFNHVGVNERGGEIEVLEGGWAGAIHGETP